MKQLLLSAVLFSMISYQGFCRAQESNGADDPVKPAVDATSDDSLLPIKLLHHEGSSYIYQGNCCQSDAGGSGHAGIIVTANEVDEKNCGDTGAASLPVSVSLMLPAEFGDTPTNRELLVVYAGDFENAGQLNPIKHFESGLFTLKDYYGKPSRLATSVKLKDAAGQTRVFTLAKCQIILNKADGSPEEVSFPLLTLSRNTPAIQQVGSTPPTIPGQPTPQPVPVTITPSKQLHQANGFPVANIANFDSAQVAVVTIDLPEPPANPNQPSDPTDPTNPTDPPVIKSVQCLMINRKL